MKFLFLMIPSLLVSSAFASDFDSRTRLSCGFDSQKKYELEITIDDLSAEEGTVTLIDRKSNQIVRVAKAQYKNQEFIFGTDLRESIQIGFDSAFGTYDVIWGFANMQETAGSIHCTEIMY